MTESSSLLVELVTESYRILGRLPLPLGQRRLVDLLNSDDPSLAICDARVMSLQGPGEEGWLHQVLHVHRAAILFAIPLERAATPSGEAPEPERIEPERIEPERIEKDVHPLVIYLPPFVLRGLTYLAKGANTIPDPFARRSPFFPLTQVEVLYQSSEQGACYKDVVVVNGRRVQAYSPPMALAGSEAARLADSCN